MLKTLKVNFTIPKDVVALLKARISERRRSAFVATAILDKLNQLEREELRRTLMEGYLARREEEAEINREWERSTMEGWG